jgi:hypothetical protein
MIRIFNAKLEKSILIDEKNENVTYVPKQYEEESPHILIELKGINLFHHSQTCEDCKAFVDALGSSSYDWHIFINGKVERLDLRSFGKAYKDNKASFNVSDYFCGTKLKLNLDADTEESIQQKIELFLKEERYEECCFLRDKQEAIRK